MDTQVVVLNMEFLGSEVYLILDFFFQIWEILGMGPMSEQELHLFHIIYFIYQP